MAVWKQKQETVVAGLGNGLRGSRTKIFGTSVWEAGGMSVLIFYANDF